jgi:long-chain fatty acid transport protein
MNMIGYSVRSSGMGGADVALGSDCAGVSGNPASIGMCSPRSLSAGISLLMPKLSVLNSSMGLDLAGEDQVFPLPYIAYAQRMGDVSPWTLGVDVYAQGGMGVDFKGFPTGPTTTDDFSSQVMYLRFTGAARYAVSDMFSIGLSAMGGYAGMDFAMFPESQGGMDVEGLSSFGYSGRLGVLLKASDAISFGAQYTMETSLDLDGGTASINFGEPTGKVDYDAKMENFTWPQEAEFGVAVMPSSCFTIAADVKWIDWSSAIEVVDLVVTNPPAGYPSDPFPDGMGGYTNTLPFTMNWEDQWVYAVGLEYVINPVHTARLGYNYGKSPVPDDYLSPLFPATVEQHATVGYGLDLGNWGIDLAYEHAFENKQTNNNDNPMENPFGPGIEVDHSQSTLHFSASYSF